MVEASTNAELGDGAGRSAKGLKPGAPCDVASLASKGGGVFATTQWTVILAAKEKQEPGGQEALETLCRAYWYPLYVYVRREGYLPEDAQDLTQGFFARFLAKDYLANVAREKGKFRSFLLVAMKHYLSDERRRANAGKRGGGQPNLSLDMESSGDAEERYNHLAVDKLSPDRLYERSWASTLLELTYARLRQEATSCGYGDIYQMLSEGEWKPKDGLTLADIGYKVHKSEVAVKSIAWRCRKRFRELLREEIGKTVSISSEIDEEIKYLASVLADGS